MPNDPTVLAVDMSSAGVSVGQFEPGLSLVRFSERPWDLVPDPDGSGTLSAPRLWWQTAAAIRDCVSSTQAPSAIALSSMMHTLVMTDADGTPLCPVYTWMAHRIPSFMRGIEGSLGADYTARTGAYFHPSFPAFKLALLQHEAPSLVGRARRIVSAKAYIGAQLTGRWVEDLSTASASGLLNLSTGVWDQATLDALDIPRSCLGTLAQSTDLVGCLEPHAARRLDLPEGLPVVAGAGDGFLANLGSGCRDPQETAITVGTTAGVRRFSPSAEVSPERGTFCYRYSDDLFLVGAASNNGGNILDWAIQELGAPTQSEAATPRRRQDPFFLPFLRGERTPFWDPEKRARWIHRGGNVTSDALERSVIEGLAFHLGIYFELVNPTPSTASVAVLSGNAFRKEGLAALLAAVVPVPVIEPHAPGLATLRGAAHCGFQALGHSADTALGALLSNASTIVPDPDPALRERFQQFKSLYFDMQ
jgi:gluconokinase